MKRAIKTRQRSNSATRFKREKVAGERRSVHGRDRPEALARLNRALGELIVDGIDTTIPLFHALLQEDAVLTGAYNIHWLEHWLASNLAAK